MALLWYDNFEDQTFPGDTNGAEWISNKPYKQFFTDQNTSNMSFVSRVMERGGVWYNRNTTSAGISRRALKILSLGTYTFGCNLWGISAPSSVSAAPVGQFGLVADTSVGLMTVFCITPGFGIRPGTLYWYDGIELQTAQIQGDWPLTNNAGPVQFSVRFTKTENNNPALLTNIEVVLNNKIVFSGDVVNNVFSVEDLYFSFLGPLSAQMNSPQPGSVGLNTATVPTQTTGSAAGSIARTRISDLYLLDDTGPAPYNKHLGKIFIQTRKPVSDSSVELSRSAGASGTTNADVVAQVPITGAFFVYGSGGQEDIYNLDSPTLPGRIAAVKTLTVASKDDMFGADIQPILDLGNATHEEPVTPITTEHTYSSTIHTQNPVTEEDWSATDVVNMKTGVRIVQQEE